MAPTSLLLQGKVALRPPRLGTVPSAAARLTRARLAALAAGGRRRAKLGHSDGSHLGSCLRAGERRGGARPAAQFYSAP